MFGQIAGTGQGLLESIQSGKFGTYEGANLVQQRAMEGAGRLTFKPTTEAGQEYTQAVGEAAAPLAAFAPLAGEIAGVSNAMAQYSAGKARKGKRRKGCIKREAEQSKNEPQLTPIEAGTRNTEFVRRKRSCH